MGAHRQKRSVMIGTILNVSCECFGVIASWITAVVTIAGLWYAYKEYSAHKKQVKTTTLFKYNERYANSPAIQKVVNYLLWRSDGSPYMESKWPLPCQKRIDPTLYGGESEAQIKPTKNQVELFMWFYEELQTAIKLGLLDLEDAKNLFAYYAHLLVNIGVDLLPVDYPDGKTWCYFQDFIRQTKEKK